MQTAKQEALQILKDLPDDITLEDIQYHLYVRKKVEKGLKEVEKGKILDEEEVAKRMSQWFGK